jgi:hypothetical protein
MGYDSFGSFFTKGSILTAERLKLYTFLTMWRKPLYSSRLFLVSLEITTGRTNSISTAICRKSS